MAVYCEDWIPREYGEMELKAREWKSGEHLEAQERTRVLSYFIHWQKKTIELNFLYPFYITPQGTLERDQTGLYAIQAIYLDLITKTDLLLGRERACRLFDCSFDDKRRTYILPTHEHIALLPLRKIKTDGSLSPFVELTISK